MSIEGRSIGKFWVKPLWEPRDVWIGVYVKEPYWEGWSKRQQVYVCILPFVPILVEWEIENHLDNVDPPHDY